MQFRVVYKIFWRSKEGFARTPPAYGPAVRMRNAAFQAAIEDLLSLHNTLNLGDYATKL